MSCPDLSTRQLHPDDWAIERDLRLAALAEAPSAFGSTLSAALGLDESDWRERLSRQVRIATFLEGRAVGMVGWAWAQSPYPAGEALLLGMWVAPSARGSGVGDALVAAAVADARRAGARIIRLSVTPGNEPALRLYARNGFVVVPPELRVEPEMTEMILAPGSDMGDGVVPSAAV